MGVRKWTRNAWKIRHEVGLRYRGRLLPKAWSGLYPTANPLSLWIYTFRLLLKVFSHSRMSILSYYKNYMSNFKNLMKDSPLRVGDQRVQGLSENFNNFPHHPNFEFISQNESLQSLHLLCVWHTVLWTGKILLSKDTLSPSANILQVCCIPSLLLSKSPAVCAKPLTFIERWILN